MNAEELKDCVIFKRPTMLAILIAIVGLAVCVAGLLWWPRMFFPGYLVGFLFWTGISIGCLLLTTLHHLVGGAWGTAIRRPLESGITTLPLMALCFLPITFGLRHLYPWTDPAVIAPHKRIYLSPLAFDIRAGLYFFALATLGPLLVTFSRRQDFAPPDDTRHLRWLQAISGPGLVLTFFVATFAAVDWAMSREPSWTSTIYGAIWIVGEGLSAFTLVVFVSAGLAKRKIAPISQILTPDLLNDLGNLMLAFIMLWAYMAYSQFLIMWSGNVTEEIPWYLRRSGGGWGAVALALIIFHFALPFVALFFRESKRRGEVLMIIAVMVFIMHVVDIVWLVVPATTSIRTPAIDVGQVASAVVATVAIGGAWLSVFFWQLGAASLVPRVATGNGRVVRHNTARAAGT